MIPLHTYQDGKIFRRLTAQMLGMLESSYIIGGNAKQFGRLGKRSGSFLKHQTLLFGPASTSFLVYLPKRNKAHIHKKTCSE